MKRDDLLRLTTLADTIKGAHSSKDIPISKWQEPRHAFLIQSAATLIEQAFADHVNEDQIGEPLPWKKTHKYFRLRPHELTVWGGKNGSFKSTALSEILLHLAVRGVRVVIVSLEMPAPKLAMRMISQAFAARRFTFEQALEWGEAVGESLSFLNYTGSMEWQESIRYIQYCAHELNTQHILLDNLTKFVGVDAENQDDQRRFTAQAHRAAIDTGVHVHIVAHTRKASSLERDRMPDRYDIAGSRTLVDQADNVVLFWRNREKEAKRGDFNVEEQPDVVLRVDKQRHGRWEGEIDLFKQPDCFRFLGSRDEKAMPITNVSATTLGEDECLTE